MPNRQEPTTTFDGVYLHYTCPYCGNRRSELADPAKNKRPFGFLNYCSACPGDFAPDWDVIHDAQASFESKPPR